MFRTLLAIAALLSIVGALTGSTVRPSTDATLSAIAAHNAQIEAAR